jgi:putative ABC transport system permease protein
METITGLESKALAYPRFRAILLGAFAGLALILATVGIFGVLSHSVAQRTHEIGVRMALGADKKAVLLMILREGLLLTVSGIILRYRHGLPAGPLPRGAALRRSAY